MSDTKPPGIGLRIIRFLFRGDLLEEIEGDFEESFHHRISRKGKFYAQSRYLLDCLLAVRLVSLSSFQVKNSNHMLLLNYLKTGFRFLWRTRKSAAINIIGLSVGIATAAIAYLYISDQYSYDHFLTKSDRIYRLGTEISFPGGGGGKFAGASYIMGEEFPAKTPGIASSSRVMTNHMIIIKGENSIEQRVHLADKELLNILEIKLLSGNKSAFGNPYDLFLSKNTYKKLGNPEKLKVLINNTPTEFQVIGVYENVPNNSSIKPEVLISMSYYAQTAPERRLGTWFDINMNMIVLRDENTDKKLLETQMTKVLSDALPEDGATPSVFLQPITEIHTDSSLYGGNGIELSLNKEVIIIIALVGILCLLISTVNYSNFSASNFIVRIREVGMRKSMGASSLSVVIQFLVESFISVCTASVFALVLISLVLPYFSDFVNDTYSIKNLFTLNFIFALLILLILTTIATGIYPAILLGKQKLTQSIRGDLQSRNKGLLGKFFLTFQVILAVFLVVMTISLSKQLNLMLELDLGYDDSNIITLELPKEEDAGILQENLLKLPDVAEVTMHSGFNGTNLTGEYSDTKVRHTKIDHNYISALGIEILEGRNFDPSITSDQNNAALINQQLADILFPGESPIGKKLPIAYDTLQNPVVIGLIRDYYFNSPKYKPDPHVLYLADAYPFQEMLIKTKSLKSVSELESIKSEWAAVYDPFPFLPVWLSDQNASQLEVENQVRKISIAGTVLAIFLATLGLTSLLSATVKYRMKEMSIRKINGASPSAIYWLFIKEFSPWVLIGLIAGVVPTYMLLSTWLQDYHQRIDLSANLGLIGASICITVFLVVVTIQLSKVIYANPVKYLRNE